MPESSSSPVSVAQAVLDAGKSCATVSSYSETFSHRQNNIKDRFGVVLGLLLCASFCFGQFDFCYIRLDASP